MDGSESPASAQPEFYSLWPTNIMTTRLDELAGDNDALSRIAKEFFIANVNETRAFKYRGNTVSLMMEEKSPALMKLFLAIQHQVKVYLAKFYPMIDPAELGFHYNTFVNYQNRDKRWALPHAHVGNQLVATYYPQAVLGPREAMAMAGALCFHDPRPVHANWMVRKENNVLAIEPKPGTLVIFPGYIDHSTFPFHDENSEKLAIVTNVRFFPKTDKNQERMFSADEILRNQMSFHFAEPAEEPPR